MAVGDLITWDYVKLALGQTDNAQQAKYEDAIADASVAIRQYTGRDFAIEEAVDTRTYSYDADGFLEVDDIVAGSVTDVKIDGISIPLTQAVFQPTGQTHYTWVELPARGQSPAMGFMRNEDRYVAMFGSRPTVVTITATFGWPEVPLDVRRAALWTVMAFSDNPNATISESIAGYSRTVANPNTAAIPARAKDILENYRRIKL